MRDKRVRSGVYQIRNIVTGGRYVGSTIHLKKRWAIHRWMLIYGRHDNKPLQRAHDEYGLDALLFEILEETADLIMREQFYLDTLRPEYNRHPNAGSALGYKVSEEGRRNISAAQIGHSVGNKTRFAVAEANRRRHQSDETRRRISEGLKRAYSEGRRSGFAKPISHL